MSQLPALTQDIDPTTGFISFSRGDTFSAARKVEFLRIFRMNLNMTEAAESVGTGRSTVVDHMDRDVSFRRAVNAAKLGVADILVSKARQVAMKDEGVRDRWSLIEKLNPDEYGKKEQNNNQPILISIDGKMLDNLIAKQNAIDAEVLE
jgi:hypothetical protein